MRRGIPTFLCIVGALGFLASLALADAKVEQQPLGPDGECIGCAISPHATHAAVLASKGSRFVLQYDNVAGPPIDQMLNATGNSFNTNGWIGQIPVVFSEDGAHWAYCYKSGSERVVMLDGKELARSPMTSAGFGMPMTFSAGAKHLIYIENDSDNHPHVVVDGQSGPASGPQPTVFMSADGARYAYTGTDPGARNQWGFVTGRQVNYFGEILQFTPTEHLFSLVSGNGAVVLVMDGKPEIKAAMIQILGVSEDGKEIAMRLTPKQGAPQVLMVNGKIVPGTEGVNIPNVYFSPDGKRYAALCQTGAGANYMMVDGKKGPEYQNIPHEIIDQENRAQRVWALGGDMDAVSKTKARVPGFTADSSKFIYVANVSDRSFLIIDDQESPGYSNTLAIEPQETADGKRIAYLGVTKDGKQHVIIDGKDQDYGLHFAPGTPNQLSGLIFSPDGSRVAYLTGQTLCVDGVAQPGLLYGEKYLFSPDGKHIAYPATVESKPCFIVDGKIVDAEPSSGQISRVVYSPDSQHIIWTTNGRIDGTKDVQNLYLDGKPVTHFFDGAGVQIVNYEFLSDGTLNFVARTEDNLRRFKVTPASDGNITAMVAAGAAADAGAPAAAAPAAKAVVSTPAPPSPAAPAANAVVKPAGNAVANNPQVEIVKVPVKAQTRKFDPKNPPADMPPPEPPETAECDSDFLSDASVGGQAQVIDATHGKLTVNKVKVTIQLNITIWLPTNSFKKLEDHENAHRKISEIYYKNADAIARKIAEPYAGKVIDISGPDLAQGRERRAAEGEHRHHQRVQQADSRRDDAGAVRQDQPARRSGHLRRGLDEPGAQGNLSAPRSAARSGQTIAVGRSIFATTGRNAPPFARPALVAQMLINLPDVLDRLFT